MESLVTQNVMHARHMTSVGAGGGTEGQGEDEGGQEGGTVTHTCKCTLTHMCIHTMGTHIKLAIHTAHFHSLTIVLAVVGVWLLVER